MLNLTLKDYRVAIALYNFYRGSLVKETTSVNLDGLAFDAVRIFILHCITEGKKAFGARDTGKVMECLKAVVVLSLSYVEQKDNHFK